MKIQIGRIYKHYKGKHIKVICIGLDSESKNEMVVIEELEESQGYPKGQIWIRSIEDFFDKVNENNQKYRFELVEDEWEEKV